MVKVELKPRDEHQYKKSIELKDNFENSKLTLDNQAWSKFSENEEFFRNGRQRNKSVYKAKQYDKTLHEGKKDYDCEYCDKSFCQKIHEEQNHKCDLQEYLLKSILNCICFLFQNMDDEFQ